MTSPTQEQRERVAKRILAASGALFETLNRPYAAVMDAQWLDVGTRCRIAGPIRRAQMTINGWSCAAAVLLRGGPVEVNWVVCGRSVWLCIGPEARQAQERSGAGDMSPWEEL